MMTLALTALLALNPGDRVLSTCDRFPDFDPKAVQHLDLGPSVYGTWYYDLIYVEVQSVLLAGQCSQPVTAETVRTEHFELSEQYGTPAEIAAQVKSWLAARAILRCPN